MSEPFLAEIMIVGFNFAPRGWAFCDGQILPINQNQSLFSLLGTTYGGDGRTSFGLPDLRSRTPIHKGNANGGITHQLGQRAGAETVALSEAEIASHDHTARASSASGDVIIPAGQVLAETVNQIYRPPTPRHLVAMHAAQIADTGSDQGHNNMQPFLTLNFVIALQGLFPSRN